MNKYTSQQAIDAFWSKVAIVTDDKCWLWLGAKNPKGYGNKKWNGRYTKAHRVSWMITYGDIPDGQNVLHHCDNPSCCNPNHLFLGTHLDNMNDMSNKGRRAVGDKVAIKGERNPNHKLIESDVRYIRARYLIGDITQQDLSKQMGVCKSTINYIVTRHIWKDVE